MFSTKLIKNIPGHKQSRNLEVKLTRQRQKQNWNKLVANKKYQTVKQTKQQKTKKKQNSILKQTNKQTNIQTNFYKQTNEKTEKIKTEKKQKTK